MTTAVSYVDLFPSFLSGFAAFFQMLMSHLCAEDIIPRILALPAKPSTVQPAESEQLKQHHSHLQADDKTDSGNVSSQQQAAAVPMSVRNRLANLRAILTARRRSTQLLEAAGTV